MQKNTLFKINLLVSLIIIMGFSIVSYISYQSNFDIYEKNVEKVSALSSDSVYNEISSIFSQPVNTSLAMSNDSLLKSLLQNEANQASEPLWQSNVNTYLETYQKQYNYDSVFLVSAATNNYYHFTGLNRVLYSDNPENEWFYQFIKTDTEYSINIDNDESTDNEIMAFVNCKIKDDTGKIIAVVGVGMKVDSLQTMLSNYEKEYDIRAALIDDQGFVQIASSTTGFEKKNLFQAEEYKDKKSFILNNHTKQQSFWFSASSKNGYVVTQYEPNLKWHFIIENDTDAAHQQYTLLLLRNFFIIALIILLVIIIITTVIKRYNIKISQLTINQELAYQRQVHEMTQGLYDNIFEIDITHDCAGGESTKKYFTNLGLSADATYSQALQVFSKDKVKPEYIQGYIDIFKPSAVIHAFEQGTTNLSYDFMITEDAHIYHWMRITARIFYWESDQSIRMITYRKDIDNEKRYELQLLDSVQKDCMTGLYNKLACEELITSIIGASTNDGTLMHAFLIFDIDNFKTINDCMGHNFGDYVISEITAEIKTQFRESDIMGRVGGDEFVVLMQNIESIEATKRKLARLCDCLHNKDFGEAKQPITCSIGVSIFPEHGTCYSSLYEKADQALYYAKNHGKNFYFIFGEYHETHTTFHAHQRDMEKLMNDSTDGMAQFACVDPIKLIYFNQKCISLFGYSTEELSSINVDIMALVHPDDSPDVTNALQVAIEHRQGFSMLYRIRHKDGHYVLIKSKIIFVSELYENKYPIFFALYNKQ